MPPEECRIAAAPVRKLWRGEDSQSCCDVLLALHVLAPRWPNRFPSYIECVAIALIEYLTRCLCRVQHWRLHHRAQHNPAAPRADRGLDCSVCFDACNAGLGFIHFSIAIICSAGGHSSFWAQGTLVLVTLSANPQPQRNCLLHTNSRQHPGLSCVASDIYNSVVMGVYFP